MKTFTYPHGNIFPVLAITLSLIVHACFGISVGICVFVNLFIRCRFVLVNLFSDRLFVTCTFYCNLSVHFVVIFAAKVIFKRSTLPEWKVSNKKYSPREAPCFKVAVLAK